MAREKPVQSGDRPLTYFLFEGLTEELFYKRIINSYLKKLYIDSRDIGGGGNIGRAVLATAEPPFVKKGQHLRIYCCIDSGKPFGQVPDFDLDVIRDNCRKEKLRNILSVDAIIAAKMIESWFFYDLDGIYDYLNVTHNKRKPKSKYETPTRCTKGDLKILFRQHDKRYREGSRAESFINSLNLRKIVSSCEELRKGIEKIQKQANDLSNHLFSVK